ncbi:MAG: HD domain-containing protein [candidate division Zixibacteria bacterium]|jgi:HD superfamily phosphohydrolase|nr:HD domain-containing protein [candidate division Zixibacteria bacterium]
MSEYGKVLQDQIYDAKVLSPLAVEIIDSAEFQRLAELRQLGFSNLVFRGARHTRFEHSIGTYFACRTIMRRIVQNHERLQLDHPGEHISDAFKFNPPNTDLPNTVTRQSRWRGLSEVVAVAGLLHDLGHVPFGHTLEDEFAGLFKRHDRLGGPRLYSMMFDESSELAKVFTEQYDQWFEKIPNSELGQLVYVILNWCEKTEPLKRFSDRLLTAKEGATGESIARLNNLENWHRDFVARHMFHPFMSDVVGNTICADLLDYLPRDRTNLAMEPRFHKRLFRYLTVRPGKHYPDEGLRVSIMVTRKGQGGQRRDVATEVLSIMRERYEMAERVFYHHKKAAASAMLAKLFEIVTAQARPRDDEKIYPAPWSEDCEAVPSPPHMTHLSDSELINYLGQAPLTDQSDAPLQRRLYNGLRFRRRSIYRTLLVVDTDLVLTSKHNVPYFTETLRGPEDAPSASGRITLERTLEKAAGLSSGEIVIYCPAGDMQSKEVDARLEIKEGAVHPLRVQKKFVYFADVKVLQDYYWDLWRAYIFVSPDVFANKAKCKIITDTFCDKFEIPRAQGYFKVRSHDFTVSGDVTAKRMLKCITEFITGLSFDIPKQAFADLSVLAAEDAKLIELIGTDDDTRQRFLTLLEASVLLSRKKSLPFKKKTYQEQIDTIAQQILYSDTPTLIAAWKPGERLRWSSYEEYAEELTLKHFGELSLSLKLQDDAKD